MGKWNLIWVTLISLCVVTFTACGGGGGDGGGGGGGDVAVSHGDFTQAATQTIGSTGGTLEITDASSAIKGLKIEVPSGAVSQDISFTVSYADVTGVDGVPSEAEAAGKLIKIETDGTDTWDTNKLFDQMIVVTLPYSDGGTDDEPTMYYAVDEDNSKLEAMGVISHDTTNKTITFLTANFSSFLAIKLRLAASELLGTGFTADTSFRPASDGWYITNYGSYLEKGGICYGMVSYARWYYTAKGAGMYTKYQTDTSEWRDDNTAIQLATRAHMAEDGRWTQTFNTVISSDDTLNNQWKNPSSRLIGLSLVHALYTTGQPQLLAIFEQRADGNRYAGHAIMTYMYSSGTFFIYDPNNPNTAPDDADRRIGYSYTSGFTLPYRSGTTASASRYAYNVIMHLSIKTAASNAAFQGLYDMAERDFTDSTIFPEVTITGCKEWITTGSGSVGDDCTESTNDSGAHMYVVDTDAVRIYATALGGYAQGGPAADAADVRQARVLDRTIIFIGDRGYWATVDNSLDSGTGKISWNNVEGVPLPLYQGENDLIFLATAEDTFSNWAGYKRDVVKSNASRADMTVTMTWGQGSSDVDLHVREPEVNGVTGRHIYYLNKGTAGSTPYLDFDNTTGYGPEHYYAADGMSTYDENLVINPNGLYGTYGWRVHYYADHDSDSETTQPITWTVSYRYLKYEDTSVTPSREYWAEGTQTGSLTTASSSGTSNFDNTGASWSSTYTIEYEQPDASEYGVDPPSVMLP